MNQLIEQNNLLTKKCFGIIFTIQLKKLPNQLYFPEM